MPHMPRFWREKGFPGWESFLFTYFENQKTAWSVAEIAIHFEPNDEKERKKVSKNVSVQTSMLFSTSRIGRVKVGKLNYYTNLNLLSSEEKKDQVIESIIARQKPRVFERVPVNQVKPAVKKGKSPNIVFFEQHLENIGVKDNVVHTEIFNPSDIYLTPRGEYYRKRVEEIINVTFKSFDLQRPVPVEWIEEYNDLVKHISK